MKGRQTDERSEGTDDGRVLWIQANADPCLICIQNGYKSLN